MSPSHMFAFHSCLKRSMMRCLKEEMKAFSLSTLPLVQKSWKPYDSRQSLYYLPSYCSFFVFVIRLSLNIIKACFGNLVLGSLQSLNQYLKTEIVLPIYRGYLPVSRYAM